MLKPLTVLNYILEYIKFYISLPTHLKMGMTKRNNLEFKIFTSEDLDWFVAARKGKGKDNPKVLYEGHDLEDAYKAILKEIGVDVPIEEREEMEDMQATYKPKKKDFP